MRARSGRTTPTWLWAAILAVVLAGGVAVILSASGSSSSSGSSPVGPPLASVSSAATGQMVDGIKCENLEQLAYHVHSHLAVFVNGHARGIPEGIGIAPPRQTVNGATGTYVVAGSCFYWLHAHTADGIIHIESPTQKTYTLGNYFDIWGQPLGPTQVGPAHGTVIAYVDGQRFSGDPRDIKVGNHVKIQLDVGKDVAPRPYTFEPGL
jgi:hypothetical protein